MAGSFATTLNRFKVYIKQREESAGADEAKQPEKVVEAN